MLAGSRIGSSSKRAAWAWCTDRTALIAVAVVVFLLYTTFTQITLLSEPKEIHTGSFCTVNRCAKVLPPVHQVTPLHHFNVPVVVANLFSRPLLDPEIYTEAHLYRIFNDSVLTPNETLLPRLVLGRDFSSNITNITRTKTHQVQQNLDTYVVWKDFSVDMNCYGYPFFLWMEDDFRLCDSAIMELHYVVDWAESHWDAWSVMRVGFGLSGLLFKCDVVKELSRMFEKREVMDTPGIDWLVSNLIHDNPQWTLFRYRHNLFQHLGLPSTIWQEDADDYRNFELTSSGCKQLLVGSYLTEWDAFDINQCEDWLMSPCDPNLVDPLVSPEKSLLQEVTRFIGAPNRELMFVSGLPAQHCEHACKNISATCAPEFFPLLNTCSVAQSLFPGCTCTVGDVNANNEPMFYRGVCHLNGYVHNAKCEGIWKNELRACACVRPVQNVANLKLRNQLLTEQVAHLKTQLELEALRESIRIREVAPALDPE